MIKYGQQRIDEVDITHVVNVLRSEYITQGPVISQFEEKVARLTNAEHGIAFNSATAALHASCMALGLTCGDILWTTPNSFVASANCALYCGAMVDFVDIDMTTFNMCPKKLEEKLESAKSDNSLPKVLVVVHFAGQPCDMKKISDLAARYNFKIIEDASHAIGATYDGQRVGACIHSDITVFSFHPVKIITTGEGGLALTNSKSIASFLSKFRTHGITRSPNEMEKNRDEPWHYEQHELGFNYRMTEMQAALGLSQLDKLDQFTALRQKLVGSYTRYLKSTDYQIPKVSSDRTSAWHLYVVLCKNKLSRKEKFQHMRSAGIGVNVHYIPIHLHPYYQNLGFRKGDFPNSEMYYDRCLTLPLHQDLTDQQIKFISEKLIENDL